MYLCNVQMCLLVKIKITVYKKHLVFCDSCLTHSFMSVKVCQVYRMKFEIFQFFKKDYVEIMQKFYSHMNLNLTCKKIIHRKSEYYHGTLDNVRRKNRIMSDKVYFTTDMVVRCDIEKKIISYRPLKTEAFGKHRPLLLCGVFLDILIKEVLYKKQ